MEVLNKLVNKPESQRVKAAAIMRQWGGYQTRRNSVGLHGQQGVHQHLWQYWGKFEYSNLGENRRVHCQACGVRQLESLHTTPSEKVSFSFHSNSKITILKGFQFYPTTTGNTIHPPLVLKPLFMKALCSEPRLSLRCKCQKELLGVSKNYQTLTIPGFVVRGMRGTADWDL